MTPYYAFIPILYPNKVEFAIGLAEIFTGGGFMVGPIVGSLLYSLGGYTTPFIVFGTSTLVVIGMFEILGCTTLLLLHGKIARLTYGIIND